MPIPGRYGTARPMIAAPQARRAAPPAHRAAISAAALLLLLSGCATVPGQDRLAEKDPLEKFNRAVWGINMTADKIVVRPVTNVYRAVAPKPVRQGVTHFFSNLTEPWSFVNNMLQGKTRRAGQNLKRFVVNTTVGIGGLIDHASKIGIQPAPEDLGQTLARWGVNGGPYLVLPLLGPTTLRDGIGSGISAYADPVNVAINQADVSVWAKRGYRVVSVIDARSELIESGGQAFLDSSLDPYAAARSAFLQRRRAQILDKEDDAGADLPADDMPPAESVPTPLGDAGALPPKPEAAEVDPGAAPPAVAAAPAASDARIPERGTATPAPQPVVSPR
ncbi:MlaA family lipoprotein [Sphingomonas bacterium]|uniref:MlaA family lipoprotein n=1 Tax=Sphingomonas bacterium TaxID=1895847 RepID=UPI0020C6F4B6|nr:VacJ family lipoprotein [Sphingomonas bacterium]